MLYDCSVCLSAPSSVRHIRDLRQNGEADQAHFWNEGYPVIVL